MIVYLSLTAVVKREPADDITTPTAGESAALAG